MASNVLESSPVTVVCTNALPVALAIIVTVKRIVRETHAVRVQLVDFIKTKLQQLRANSALSANMYTLNMHQGKVP